MTSAKQQPTSKADDFVREGEKSSTFLGDFLYFLRQSRKWWMLPLIGLLLMFGMLMLLASTGAAPFIYTLF